MPNIQPQFPNEFGELSGMLTGEQHVVRVNDEEDGRSRRHIPVEIPSQLI